MAQDTIAIHWEAAPPRSDHSQCAQQVADIDRYHRANGYSGGIAYSWLVCQHGQIFTGRGWGRQSAATCNGHWNARAWSVCWMGGPGFSPSQEALRGIRTVVDEARTRGARTVIGHREACATQCPGDELMAWKNAGLPVTGSPVPPSEEDDLPYTEAQLRKIAREGTNESITYETFVHEKIRKLAREGANESIMYEDFVQDKLRQLAEEAVRKVLAEQP